ncbi:MAG: hypothetical protein QW343_00300 [Candidatus Norongarragalinales archaeon]
MDALQNFLEDMLRSVTSALRKFVAFALIMFFLGTIYGFFLPIIVEKTGIHFSLLVAVPIALALLAYVSTEVAAVLFVILLGLMLLVFV